MIFTGEDIKGHLRTRPFTPLRFITSTGQAYDVYHPDLVWVGLRSIMIGTPSPDNPSLYDMVTRVALVHIMEIRDLPMPAAPPADSAPAA